ncbi:glutathione ABC transporter substrate-binding protein [Sporosarcina ureilytica]|uniref:Glutathione ABC transporter substrate-binding protein n=1 Tax=Sporosarcina ureilytica TaxID=298596 RepID=A0A1D8JFK6_9BACL|nr:glutathione ABC transporter substrate-binding protein [Sporosarcina ureilytica]AOV07491.1 glutathione ABC transporter substrate-binding protein [Sporosarcina ureilytica]
MRKRILFGFLVSILAIMMVACSNSSDENDNNSADEQSDDNTSEASDLTIMLGSDPNSLDPHGANDGISLYVMSTMYDKLVYLDKDLTMTPGLAESLEQISDTVWEAKIREGVEFHDGSILDAEVVKANLDRVRDPEIASPLSFLYDMIEEVEVIDTYTVHIKTEFPFASLPAHLAHPGGSMISKKSIDADNEAIKNGGEPFATVNEAPVGTGPFKFESREHGDAIKVVKNEKYWDTEKAKSASITFKTVPEAFTRIAELETGGADLIYPVSPVDVALIDETDSAHVQQSKSSNLTYLGFNTEVEPFNKKEVRQAISMAINRENLIDGLLEGRALPAIGPLAPTVYGYSDSIDTLGYDVEKAKALMKEAGYEDGFKTTLLTYETSAYADLAVFLQAELKNIGIEVDVEIVETGAFLEAAGEGNTEMFIGAWGTVTLDADYGLYPMFHSSNAGYSGNRSFLKNDAIDEVLQAAREEGDEQKRLELYEQAQNLLAEEAPVAYLYHSELLAGLHNDVKDFWQYPSSIFFLRDMHK